MSRCLGYSNKMWRWLVDCLQSGTPGRNREWGIGTGQWQKFIAITSLKNPRLWGFKIHSERMWYKEKAELTRFSVNWGFGRRCLSSRMSSRWFRGFENNEETCDKNIILLTFWRLCKRVFEYQPVSWKNMDGAVTIRIVRSATKYSREGQIMFHNT